MQNRLRRYDVTRWAGDFLGALAGAREMQDRIEAKLLPLDERNEIIDGYKTQSAPGAISRLRRHAEPIGAVSFYGAAGRKNDHAARLPRG